MHAQIHAPYTQALLMYLKPFNALLFPTRNIKAVLFPPSVDYMKQNKVHVDVLSHWVKGTHTHGSAHVHYSLFLLCIQR